MATVNYLSVSKAIANLRKGNKDDISSIVMYIINPQLTAFGYDIYDFSKNEIVFDEGIVKLTATDNIKLLISFDDKIANGDVDYLDEEYKIYIYFSFQDLKYNLYFKVLGNWELVEAIDFEQPQDEAKSKEKITIETKKFERFSRYITLNNITKEHKNKGEKYFTEAVLDRYLENKEFNNEFIRTALMSEFKKPSAELITMLASALGKEFTTLPQEKVQESLQPMMEQGLFEAIETLVNGSPTPTSPVTIDREDFSYLSQKSNDTKVEPKVETKPEPKEEAKVETKQEKQEPKNEPKVEQKSETKADSKKAESKQEPKKEGKDKLTDLGFDLTNKKPVANATKEAPKTDNNGALNLDDLMG